MNRKKQISLIYQRNLLFLWESDIIYLSMALAILIHLGASHPSLSL